MPNTNIITKTGKDFVNIFYNVPETLRMNKTDGKAVGGLRIEIFVDGMQFFDMELNFYGANSSEPFGRITVPQLGDGRYTYRITETVVALRKEQYGKNKIETSSIDGLFTIDDQTPRMNTGFGTGHGTVLGY